MVRAMSRVSSRSRRTSETAIELSLNLDGSGQVKVDTGIGFFDHMLTLFGRHALLDLEVKVDGDLHIDGHHTVEDTGIVLGQCLAEAVGDKAGIVRYGHSYLPMDETLARVALDLSGRGLLVFRGTPEPPPVIAPLFPFTLVEEFLRALAHQGGITLHAELLYGRDAHHMAEALFKGTGRALRAALARDPRETGVPSTKGSL